MEKSQTTFIVENLLKGTFDPPYAYISTLTDEDYIERGNIQEDTKKMLESYNKFLNYWTSVIIQNKPESHQQYVERFVLYVRQNSEIINYNVMARNKWEQQLQNTINFLNEMKNMKITDTLTLDEEIITQIKNKISTRVMTQQNNCARVN